MTQETLNVIQFAGLVATFVCSIAALFLSWQNNRSSDREVRVAAEQLRASIIPVPMIQDSRLTWRGPTLVVLSVRLRNVGAGPILGIQITGIRIDRTSLAFEALSAPKADVVMPTTDVEQRLRFVDPPQIAQPSLVLVEIEYFDVLGNHYQQPLPLTVVSGTGSGAMAGVRPARISRNP
ncbi:hypothetical protein [Micromonospora craniellae]|uniref:Uncharacterized protein n=1 Tax=Micromonospora craniellae TaxID=2294034 RepID=A0A372FWN2_9ACTN|nr:hypothetical protein [Micromonospora craniellae]QOC92652.1 hypothetical protein ID554_02475 [Micromonospora craniellae]RFS45185.1 hypothetical protein D0Q02_18465 [Micromonospora craniellae]